MQIATSKEVAFLYTLAQERTFGIIRNMEKELIKKYNHELLEKKQHDTSTFIDHWILTASLGSFTVSFLFFQNIELNEITSIIFLYLSWIFFIGSVILTLISALYVIQDCQNTIKKINDRGTEYDPTKDDERDHLIVDILNQLSVTSFVLGLILSLIFIILNTK